MYHVAQRGGDPKAYETAREALCQVYEQPDSNGAGACVTNCDGRPLTEAQLTTLSIAEGLLGQGDATGGAV